MHHSDGDLDVPGMLDKLIAYQAYFNAPDTDPDETLSGEENGFLDEAISALDEFLYLQKAQKAS